MRCLALSYTVKDPSDNPGWIAREPPGRAASDDKVGMPAAMNWSAHFFAYSLAWGVSKVSTALAACHLPLLPCQDSAPTANAHEPHRVPISVTADAE